MTLVTSWSLEIRREQCWWKVGFTAVENEGEEEGEMAEGDKSLKSFDKDGLKA